LKKEFDYIPRIAWLLDSFGHSAGNARLYADIGFDAMFFARMDRPEIKNRFKNSELDFIWRPFS
jgi:alpha-mannosidase